LEFDTLFTISINTDLHNYLDGNTQMD